MTYDNVKFMSIFMSDFKNLYKYGTCMRLDLRKQKLAFNR